MEEAMKKFENAMDDMMSKCKAAMGQFVFEEGMDGQVFGLMRSAFTLGDAFMDLMKAHTKMMSEMNEKLDKLVDKND